MKTTVVNKRTHPFDVYIGRGSKWGNPFRIGVHGNREEVCDRYIEWMSTQPHLLQALKELKGKRLGCFCAPERCHGDFLAALADRKEVT